MAWGQVARLAWKWSVFVRVGSAGTGWGLAVWGNAFLKTARSRLLIWSHPQPGFCWADCLVRRSEGAFEKYYHPHTCTAMTATSLGWGIANDSWEYHRNLSKDFFGPSQRQRHKLMCLLRLYLHLLSHAPSGRKSRTWSLNLNHLPLRNHCLGIFQKSLPNPDSSSTLIPGASVSLSPFIHIPGSRTRLPVFLPLWSVLYALFIFPSFTLWCLSLHRPTQVYWAMSNRRVGTSIPISRICLALWRRSVDSVKRMNEKKQRDEHQLVPFSPLVFPGCLMLVIYWHYLRAIGSEAGALDSNPSPSTT